MKQQRENVSRLENELKVKIKSALNELEKYRRQCLLFGIGYYEAFKLKQRRELDFKANLKRVELAGYWDEIKQMLVCVEHDTVNPSVEKFIYKHQLPDDFQCREEWIRLGTYYRLLVEPLDIANYYRLGNHEDSTGHYLVHGRPRRYKILQKWLEDSEQNTQLLAWPQLKMFTQDSCFWAYVEEISYLMHNNNLGGDHKSALVKSKCQELEDRVGRLIDSNGLCIEEAVSGQSTFKMVVKRLWEQMTPLQKASSPFGAIINQYPKLIE